MILNVGSALKLSNSTSQMNPEISPQYYILSSTTIHCQSFLLRKKEKFTKVIVFWNRKTTLSSTFLIKSRICLSQSDEVGFLTFQFIQTRTFCTCRVQRNWVFDTNSDFLIPIYLCNPMSQTLDILHYKFC